MRYRLAFKAKAPIWIVFDDDEFVLKRKLDQPLSPFQRHGNAGRIVKIRNIEQGLRQRLAFIAQRAKTRFQLIDDQALTVLWDAQ